MFLRPLPVRKMGATQIAVDLAVASSALRRLARPTARESFAAIIARAKSVHPTVPEVPVVDDASRLLVERGVQELSAAQNVKGETAGNLAKAIGAHTNAWDISAQKAALEWNVVMDVKVGNVLLTALVRTATVIVKAKTVISPKSPCSLSLLQ